MKNDSNLENDQPKKAGEVNHELLPKITNDEIDLEIDFLNSIFAIKVLVGTRSYQDTLLILMTR